MPRHLSVRVGSSGPGWPWSETNEPWASGSVTEGWPAGVTEAELVTGTGDFRLDINNTLAPFSSSDRVVIQLPDGQQGHIKSFYPYGSTTYAGGVYNGAKLRGFHASAVGAFQVVIDANIMTTEQTAAISAMTESQLLEMWGIRLDSTAGVPNLLGGVDFMAYDQQTISFTGVSIGTQPAPHTGLFFYPGSSFIVNNCRFRGFARASYSRPPFEAGNVKSQRAGAGSIFRRVEFDGRLAAEINPARPRRCGPVMGNNDAVEFVDCYAHHSNVSRGAWNDSNYLTTGPYTYTRVWFSDISDQQNDGLGGGTNASLMGWENCNATITLNGCGGVVTNTNTTGQIQQHLQFTAVDSSSLPNWNAAGGKLYVYGGQWRNTAFPALDGMLSIRSVNPSGATLAWNVDHSQSFYVYDNSGTRLSPWVYSGTWTNAAIASAMSAGGYSATTHYLIRQS